MPFKSNADRRHRIPKQRHRVTNWAAYDAGLHAALRAGQREIGATLDNGRRRSIALRHDLSPRQAKLLLAGGVINWLRERLAA